MRRIRSWSNAASPAVPGAVVIWFGFNSGGFFPGATAVVALALAVFLVLRLTLAEEPLAGVSPALVVATGALAALAAWALVSSSWSHAPGRAMLEFSRDLAYLLAVAAFGCAAFRPERFAQAVRFLAVAVFIVCAAGVITRVLPDVWTIQQRLATDRLSYPLTYWNALGLLAGLGTVLAVHLTSSAGEPRAVRVLGAALTPALVTAAYLTFSRGGIAAALVGLVAFLLIGRPAHLAGALVAVVPACALALVTAVGADALATNHPNSPAGVADGHRLGLAVMTATLGAALLRALALGIDRRIAERMAARPPWPGQRRALAWAAGAGVVVLVLAVSGAPAFAQRQYHRFVEGNRTSDADQRTRLLDPGNNGRIYKWRVSLDAFDAQPFHGHGAGTWQNLWTMHRPVADTAVDGHSLYLEVMGELGIVGLLLLVAGLVVLLGGFAARARGPGRGPAAALLACGIAWALHAGIDWDWEMPAVTWWLFALGGMALAAAPGSGRLSAPGRTTRIAAGLGCAVLAITPVLVIRSQSRLDEAVEALRAGRCGQAIDAALDSAGAIGARREPFEVIGFCDVRLGRADLAERALENAVERDPESWEPEYGLALVRGSFGRDPRPAMRRALALNPRSPMVVYAADRLIGSSPSRWRREARRLSLPLR
jgi:O-Antigen ligase